MYIKQIKSQKIWDEFIDQKEINSFLHSFEWGDFNKTIGNKIWRIGLYKKGSLKGLSLIIKIKAKRGTFLLCPHGPILEWGDKNQFKEFTKYLIDLAKKEKAHFIRICPLLECKKSNLDIFKENGFINAPIHMHPEKSWILDITQKEEELLYNMRKNTRYSIRKAAKEGVEIKKSESIDDLRKFYDIYMQTVKRQHFVPFSLKYLKEEFRTFSKNKNALLFFAKYNNDIVSSAFIIFSKYSGFYHHGASTLKYPKIPASHLMQWEIIKEAKKRGCKRYNFWGIAPEGKPNHPWAGITLFKKGFGGFCEDYVPAQDFILYKPRYFGVYIIEKVRKIKRRL